MGRESRRKARKRIAGPAYCAAPDMLHRAHAGQAALANCYVHVCLHKVACSAIGVKVEAIAEDCADRAFVLSTLSLSHPDQSWLPATTSSATFTSDTGPMLALQLTNQIKCDATGCVLCVIQKGLGVKEGVATETHCPTSTPSPSAAVHSFQWEVLTTH